VRLPAFLLPEVKKHLRTYVGSAPGAWVFVGPKGGHPTRANFHRIWDKARMAAGIPHLHLHDLRHTGNTLAAETGATLRELMTRMGHSSTRAALIYLHAREERDQAIALGIDSMVSAATKRTQNAASASSSRAEGTAPEKGHAGGHEEAPKEG
jgi:integrase